MSVIPCLTFRNCHLHSEESIVNEKRSFCNCTIYILGPVLFHLYTVDPPPIIWKQTPDPKAVQIKHQIQALCT